MPDFDITSIHPDDLDRWSVTHSPDDFAIDDPLVFGVLDGSVLIARFASEADAATFRLMLARRA